MHEQGHPRYKAPKPTSETSAACVEDSFLLQAIVGGFQTNLFLEKAGGVLSDVHFLTAPLRNMNLEAEQGQDSGTPR